MPTKTEAIDVQKLTEFTVRALRKVGVPEEDARLTAEMLVRTDVRGVDSHGVARLAGYYIGGLKAGRINPTAKPKVVIQNPATAVVDGDSGLGFVASSVGMKEAMRMAETAGAGFVNVRNSTHFGAAVNFAMMALEKDMIGISMTDSVMDVVPPGASAPGIGTNPIAVAAPAGKRPPFIFDMATSVVAAGKIQIARREGKLLPEGWVIDGQGNPVTKPEDWIRGQGGIVPLGTTPVLRSYKGFGLAMVVEILSALLAGSQATLPRQNSPEARGKVNHFFGAINVASFLPVDTFKGLMDEMVDTFKALPKLPGVDKIYIAGDYEAEFEEERRANGIPLHESVIKTLKDMAADLDIEYDL